MTILDKAAFPDAQNHIINPELHRIKGAKFNLKGLTGLHVKRSAKD